MGECRCDMAKDKRKQHSVRCWARGGGSRGKALSECSSPSSFPSSPSLFLAVATGVLAIVIVGVYSDVGVEGIRAGWTLKPTIWPYGVLMIMMMLWMASS